LENRGKETEGTFGVSYAVESIAHQIDKFDSKYLITNSVGPEHVAYFQFTLSFVAPHAQSQ
jgi:hypothetical protein